MCGGRTLPSPSCFQHGSNVPPLPLENAAHPPRPGQERPPGGDDGGNERRQFNQEGCHADQGAINVPPLPCALPLRRATAAK